MGGLYLGGKLVSPVVLVEKPVVTGEWQPNPNWWDIKKILDEDTRDYPGKVGVILYNFNDVSDFTLSRTSMTAVATSDGAFYSYANNGANISHNWDTTQDKDDGRGFKTRWVIYYYTSDTTTHPFSYDDTRYGWEYNYIAYAVLRINCNVIYANFFHTQRLLEFIDNTGYNISGTTLYNAFWHCKALRKLPDNLDTSNVTNFQSFCSACSSLAELPDNLDTSSGTNFSNFCNGCHLLQKLPDNLNTSNGTDFRQFSYDCLSLVKLPDNLDTSNGTDFYRFCYQCNSLLETSEIVMSKNTTDLGSSQYNGPFVSAKLLKKIFITLPSNTDFWLNMSTRISIESFRYIADHAPDVTATPRTLTIGSTNITRCNEADPTIITDLNAKGWTVA